MMFEGNPLPMMVFDHETLAILEVNNATVDHYGYSHEEFLSMTIKDIRPPEEIPKLLDVVSKIPEGIDKPGSFKHLKKDGSLIDVEIISHSIDFKGRSAQLVMIFDITERKKAEEDIQLFQGLVNRSNDAICVIAPETGRILNVNDKMCKNLGYTREELLQMRVIDIEAIFSVSESWNEHVENVRTAGHMIIEGAHIRNDGTTFPVEVNISFVEFPDRHYMVAVARDISERKIAEKALKKEKEFTENAIDAQMDTFFVFDPETGQAIRWNKRFRKISGYTDNEIAELKAPDSYYSPEDIEKAASTTEEILRVGHSKIEMSLICKDRRKIPTEYFSSVIKDEKSNPKYIISVGRDITERIKAEEDLRESEEKYRNLIERANDGIIIAQDGIVKFSNKRLAQIFGYTVQEIIGIDFLELVFPDERPKILGIYKRRTLGEDIPGIYEMGGLHKGGQRIDIEINSGIISFQGKPATMSYVREITERKKAEEDLRKSEAKNKAILSAIPDMMFRLSGDGVHLDFYSSALDDLFIDPKNFLGKRVDEVLPDWIAEKYLYHIRAALDTGEMQIFEYELDFDEGPRQFEARLVVSGKDETLSIVRDITERNKAEEAIAEARHFTDNLIQKANVMIIGLDDTGNIQAFNPAAEAITGYTKAELKGKNWFEVLVPKDIYPDVWEAFNRLMRGGLPKLFENPILTKNGEERIISWSNNEIKHGDKIKGTISFGIDITERKKAEEELKKSRNLLGSIRKIQELFITRGSHEQVFNSLLETLVSITDSAYGFIDEVLQDENGELYKKNLAISDISWDEESRRLYKELQNRNQEFRNLNNLSGAPVLTGELVISNDPSSDPSSGGLPHGHPPINSFMGIPMYFGGELIGVAGISNRTGGYNEQIADFLEPFIATCGGIIHAMRSERKEQEFIDTIRESENRLYTVIGHSSVVIWAIDQYGTFTFSRGKFLEKLSLRPDEVVGRSLFEIYAHNSQIISDTHRVLAGETFSSVSEESGFIFENRYVPLNDNNGSVIGAIGVAMDVTERIKAQEALKSLATTFSARTGQEFFETVSEHLATALNVDYAFVGEFLKDEDKVRVAGGYARGKPMKPFEYALADTPCENVIGQSNCLYPSGVQKLFPKDVLLTEMRIEGYLGSPLFDSSGDPNGIIVILDTKPITNESLAENLFKIFAERVSAELERMKTEEKLKASEEMYHNLVETAQDLIWRCDEDGRFTFLNKAWEMTHGYKIEEMIGKSFTEFQTPEAAERDIKEFGKHLQGGSITGYETTHISKSGEELHLVFNALPLYDSDGRIIGTQGTAYNITDRKILEEQLLQAQKLEAVGRLAGGVAHDFNNILTAIIGNSSLLDMKLDKTSPMKHYVDQILSLSERAATLTKSLLAFSRKQIISLKPVDLNKIISNVQKILLRLIGEDIELKTELISMDLIVNADPNQVEQVMMNLSTNARDAMPDGGVLSFKTAYTEINEEFINVHGYGTPGPYAILTVEDTGTGMDEETREKIFEPFFTTKELGKGTGLGLASIYGIVRQHNGYIDVQSEVGKGTSFNIYLPIIEPEEDIKGSEILTMEKGLTGTILLAEDDEDVRTSTRKILELFADRVIEAIDGMDAIEKFKEHKEDIDLLILDVIMPRMKGKEAYEEIKKIRPDVKALFISGHAEDILSDKGILEEGINFIYKPATPSELYRKIEEVISSSGS
jgi:PAS domain S-box-containing protein